MTARPTDAHEHWRRELRETPDCVPIERMGETLTDAEQDHVAHCARCEAELALWEEFRDAAPSPAEGAAVQWIAAEVARRRAGGNAPGSEDLGLRPRAWLRQFLNWRPQVLAAAAVATVAVAIGLVIIDREPPVVPPGPERNAYRSQRLDVKEPTGDLPAPPTTFHWLPVAGAADYDVTILEVDRRVLWQARAPDARIAIDPAIVRRFEPGKTILWEVTARGPGGTVLAESGTQRFRVAIKPRKGE